MGNGCGKISMSPSFSKISGYHLFEPSEKTRSRRIDAELQSHDEKSAKSIKVLLLGPGESGKSTIIKQIKHIHCKGYTLEELAMYRPAVFGNAIQGLIIILRAMVKLNINFVQAERLQDVREFFSIVALMTEDSDLSPRMARIMSAIWHDVGVQHCAARSKDYQLFDSAIFFLNALDRVSAPNYIPTFDDMLRSRIKTTGIVEMQFNFKDRRFRLIDVGGQRSERRRWIHCFDDVTAVIFVVALSDYHLSLEEDPSINRMDESLNLFDSIVRCPYMDGTEFIVFLNKVDIFEDSIKNKHIPLSDYFPNFNGRPYDVETAKLFLCVEFEKVYCMRFGHMDAGSKLYSHFTCATNTENIRFVFEVSSDAIIKQNLSKVGLY